MSRISLYDVLLVTIVVGIVAVLVLAVIFDGIKHKAGCDCFRDCPPCMYPCVESYQAESGTLPETREFDTFQDFD